jgi:hypothetical protein
MSEITHVEYESNFLADDWEDDDDYELEAFVDKPFDPETQVKLRYGLGQAVVTITEENQGVSLKSLIEANQSELGFRDVNEISARVDTGFVDQSLPPQVGVVYTLAAVGDSKGCTTFS